MTPAHAIAALAAIGTPADRLKEAAAIIEAVVATALIGEEDRKARDRARKAEKAAERKSEEQRGRDRNSAEFQGAARNGAEPKTPVVDSNNNPDNSGNNTSQQQRRPSRASRGARLPDDFEPLPNILELARSLGFTDAEYWDHFERFKDYWRGVSGAKGVKLDWQGTWRNRIKDLADHRRSRTNGQPPRNSLAEGFKVVDNFVSEFKRREAGEGFPSDEADPRCLPRLRQGAG